MTTRSRLPDYYAILGIPPDVTSSQIKKAYRKLAREHHPDTNPGDTDAADRFKAITEAYEILTDPVRRQAYDATRPPVTSTMITIRTRTARPSAASSACWKTSGARSGPGTAKSRPWSSSLPAAPNANNLSGATTRPAAGTPELSSAQKS